MVKEPIDKVFLTLLGNCSQVREKIPKLMDGWGEAPTHPSIWD
jgi:hypothetical protein